MINQKNVKTKEKKQVKENKNIIFIYCLEIILNNTFVLP